MTLIGANGAGKTTTLKAIAGLAAGAAGRIVFEGADIGALRRGDIVRRGIALVPEGRRVFGALTVRENLQMGALRGVARRRAIADVERRVRASSRACASGASQRPARCPAASSRCWRSAAR